MNDLQKILFSLLCEFDEICRKHNIVYYLSGGTNLGALRHGGFIPWDDDADVRMPRKEYEKLEAVIDDEMPQGRELLSHSRFSEYISIIPRYVSKETTSIAKSRMIDGTPHGVFLDILILDPMPKKDPELLQWKKNLYIYGELLDIPVISASRQCDWDSIDYNELSKYYKKAEEFGLDTVLSDLEEKLFNIKEEDAEYYCMRFTSTWVGMSPIEWYGTPREVLFEGKKLYVAQYAELCAYSNYGPEWKNIPEVEARTGHSTLKLPNIASGNCEREYMQLIDVESVKKANIEYKKSRIKFNKIKQDTFEVRAQPYFRYLTYKLNSFFAEHGTEYVKENTKAGIKAFEKYISLQISAPFHRNGFYVPLSDEHADILAYVCYKENKILKLQQILSVRERAVGLSEYQAEMKKYCDDMIEVMKLIDIKKFDEAKVLLCRNSSHDLKQVSYVRSKLQIDLHFASNIEELKEICAYAEQAMQFFEDDGEIEKYYGDAIYAYDNETEATEIYERALDKINNGLILKELERKGIERASERMEELCFSGSEEDDDDNDKDDSQMEE